MSFLVKIIYSSGMASKIFYTKDWRYGVQFETFTKALKNSDIKVYKNGFHHWADSHGCNFYAMVIHRFRIIVWKQDERYGCYYC